MVLLVQAPRARPNGHGGISTDELVWLPGSFPAPQLWLGSLVRRAWPGAQKQLIATASLLALLTSKSPVRDVS